MKLDIQFLTFNYCQNLKRMSNNQDLNLIKHVPMYLELNQYQNHRILQLGYCRGLVSTQSISKAILLRRDIFTSSIWALLSKAKKGRI